MGRGPISTVEGIEIIGDVQQTDAEVIKMALGITKGTDIRSIDLNQLNNRVLKVPGIKNSSTRLLSNGNLVIKIEKHHAVAIWSDGVYYYPLSADGTKIDTPSETRDENSVVFRGNTEEFPNDLTDIIKSATELSKFIEYMEFIESRRWNIHTNNGTIIYLPENNPTSAITKIKLLNQTHKLLSRNIEIIDMRNDARILVKTKK